MSWLQRAPHAGWYVVLTLAVCVLLAAGSALYGLHARQLVRQVSGVLDSLAVLQCVPVKPGSEVRVFPPRRDTLPRAAR
jgi:hypothetical protein